MVLLHACYNPLFVYHVLLFISFSTSFFTGAVPLSTFPLLACGECPGEAKGIEGVNRGGGEEIVRDGRREEPEWCVVGEAVP